MYRVAVAANVSSVPSFESAVKTAKTEARAFGLELMQRASRIASGSLYRSPKARMRVAGAMFRQGENVINGIEAAKFPRKVADVSLKAGSAAVTITKEG